MPMISKFISSTWLLFLGVAHPTKAGNTNESITITLDSKPTHEIPNLYGMMFEDINHSGEGGLFAQLLRNPALQIKDPNNQEDALEAWQASRGITLKAVDLSKDGPLSQALPNALEITVPAKKTAVLSNSGYWGMKIDRTWMYTASFFAKLSKAGTKCGPKLAVQLMSRDQAETLFGEKEIESPCLTQNWQKFEVQIQPTLSGTNANNSFAIKFTSNSDIDEVIHITLVNLFPPTYKNRAQGVRKDLAEVTADSRRAFFRWGGNNMEGLSAQGRYLWNKTVGPIENRPGRLGNWGYVNTDGFGLLETLQFCEDLGMEFIGSVWAGLSLSPTTPVPEAEIDQYVQEAIDMINFIVGPVSTPQGALRASLGHAAPFNMVWCEIGNEDFKAPESYVYRWRHFATPLMKVFPQLKFIATTLQPNLSPTPHAYDIHSYQPAKWFAQHTHDYDTWSRNGPKIFQLEFAANTIVGKGPQFPTQEGAVGEAAYMTGHERNSDIVQGVAYAPTYCNTQSAEASQWHPNLINFDALSVTKNPSYYVQQMFAQHLGTHYLPTNIPPKPGPMDWSATITDSGTVYLKLVNSGGLSHTLNIVLPWKPTNQVVIQTLTNPNNSNNPPVTEKISTGSKNAFSLTISPQTVAVMTISKA
ncbi:hypothetical protein CROQUDRAFT_108302 [Cronartium quercuum f. sp. fusiforme G11]|uniref:non-reducing end alpha-L-arabinofuranosidase n=1 Tax=Cronartium quercuum f. sp. fusiforme G11 TaxID=708437 RepID=A0A9P6NIF8_9BASI|nr:hypothetical protein CROQUDRAFT_108302 [Cronartium quercuum f. sp. fusiforme G11]